MRFNGEQILYAFEIAPPGKNTTYSLEIQKESLSIQFLNLCPGLPRYRSLQSNYLNKSFSLCSQSFGPSILRKSHLRCSDLEKRPTGEHEIRDITAGFIR